MLSVAGALIVGCDAGTEHVCPAVATITGIGVDIEPSLADHATIRACWADRCREQAVQMFTPPATTQMAGRKWGIAILPDMPDAPIDVTLTVYTADRQPVVHERLTIDPVMSYPHGPECGGAAQAGLVVTADKRVRQR
ncbi:hypothetical protein [Herbihabitans rhizosphaerae]|uniref:hypothetical protein n=1 Tax=Herbihabitans rhizosphaerae TaxID=1872711 RepID=UPI00102B0C14|nr:hypothetical protein [Herbihabitans rhizosphaerae]